MCEKHLTERVYPWGHRRRFNAFPEYMKKVHGSRMQKLSIDAGFSCPNRDGTKGFGGCSFCNNKAFNPSYCSPDKTITRQLEEGMIFHKNRYRKAEGYFAYFQAYSNTFAPLPLLEKLYFEALEYKQVKGLIIGTRPDCIDDAILDLLQKISEDFYVAVEYGIESCYNKTLSRINRGHTFEEAVKALESTASRGIDTGAHFIFGLPGETREEMLAEATIISGLPVISVKFHQLQILKGTRIEEEYNLNPSDFLLFEFNDYMDFIISFLEILNPSIVVERFTGEAPPGFLAREPWSSKRTDQIVCQIEKRLEELDTWQGKFYMAAQK
jgi:radical SAM protein (TIGR01212 family)